MPGTVPDPKTLLDSAIAHHRAGRLAEAESAYRQILETDPRQFDALRFLGVIAHQRGAKEEAASLLEQATAIRADVPEAFNELGAVHHSRNNLEAARICLERALTLRPNFYEARLNLIRLYCIQRNFEKAQTELELLASHFADRPEIYANLGVVLHEQGKLQAAIECYRKALSLDPHLTQTRFNLAHLLELLGDVSSAIEQARAALDLDPDNVHMRVLLGRLFHVQGRRDEAKECFQRVIGLRPDFAEARWCSTMSELALAYGPDDNPNDSREAFAKSLTQLIRWFEDMHPADGPACVGTMQPYFLAYHECNNLSLLSRYGDLCVKLMQQLPGADKIRPNTMPRTGKVRVGMISGKIYDQSVWTAIVKGWCQYLNQDRFELHLFYTGKVVDRETDLARSLVTQFVTGLKDFTQWTKEILDRNLDVLLYPEIGMDSMSVRLATLRLAPVQAASWGHPETTGLPTVDYYLSAEDFEPPGAQAWYREKLVALPGFGCIYEPHSVPFDASTIDELTLDRSGVLLLCPGTPYKYSPQHDAIFIAIARRVPRSRFVFCHDINPNVSGLVQKRLQAAFVRAGMRFDDHVVFVPHQHRAGFFGLMQVTDVCLDTIGFSGFNTTMQAIECGLPVVGYEGHFMRGRFATGILRRIGLSELVATTEEQYVERVAKLANDVAYLQRVRTRIAEAGPGLFCDLTPLAAFEDFLETAARSARA